MRTDTNIAGHVTGKKSFSGTWALNGSLKEKPAELGIRDCLVMLPWWPVFHYHHPVITPKLLSVIYTGHVYRCHLS